MKTTLTRIAIALLAATIPQSVYAQASNGAEGKARLLEKSNDWSIFIHEGDGGKVCFATSVPASTEPKGANRAPVYFYVTTWQKDGIQDELSVKLGYEVKPDTTPTVTIGNETFEFFARDDKAFIKNPADERKLLQAMQRGSDMEVKASSARGTETVDKYSLSGITAAVKKIDEVCK